MAADPPGPTNRIEIPTLVRSNLGITFAQVEVRSVAQTLRVPGAFELQPLARREYRMALSGRVELLVDQHERVDLGQPLFRFQSPAWPELLHEIISGEQAIDSAQGESAVAEARALEARKKLTLARSRLQGLAESDFKNAELEASANELEASLPRLEAERQLAETRLSNARRTREHALHRAATASGLPEEQLEEERVLGDKRIPLYETIDWIEVRAEEAGIVEALHATDGAFVESPDLVLSVVDPSQVRFRALALQGDLPAIMSAVSTHIVPPQSPGLAYNESIPAQTTLGLEAHPTERTMVLIAQPEASAAWIRPGVSAFLEIVVASTEAPTLAIPRSAIVRDGIDYVFFRRDPKDPNAAIRVQADMGISDGRWVALHSGVMRGDEVVLTGAYELKLATALGESEPLGGHVHADGTTHEEH